ncbi:MAG: glycosyltransferase family 2 protein [Chloroflexi bacterium]|nr:glycosyltransferase family 2 protein [Chloroflexota bacterium]
MKLSIIIPCYNERTTVVTLLDQVRAVDIGDIEKEIVIVDDFSTDGTRDILKEQAATRGDLKLHFLPRNQGKGAACREGLKHATGDILLIQDADLEYDPADYPVLLRPILAGRAKAVYGSRFLGEHKAMYFWHAVGNQLLTLITNVLFDTTLTDMETCYKVFTKDIGDRLVLKSNRWGFDPEITAKIMRMGHRIYEVPISYTGREHWEGKKIVAWRDGPRVLLTLLRYRFFS